MVMRRIGTKGLADTVSRSDMVMSKISDTAIPMKNPEKIKKGKKEKKWNSESNSETPIFKVFFGE